MTIFKRFFFVVAKRAVAAANAVVLELILGFGGHQQIGIGVNQNFVVTVVIGKHRFDQFTEGIGRAGSPGGLPAFGENNAVPLPCGEGGELGLEIRVTLQRHVEVMTQLEGRKKHPVVLQLSGDVIN